MNEPFEIEAHAKTNLWLRILGKRDDGFHEIETRMVRLSLSDRLTLRWRDDELVTLKCSDETIPVGEENLVVKAVRALEQHTGKTLAADIELEKQIPSGAGLGGGSSDAAATLRALNEMAVLGLSADELAAIGAGIGSDVPFFLFETTCDCRGRGEIVEPVQESPESLPVFLIKPAFEIPAAWAYRNYAESSEYDDFLYESQECPWGAMINDLERPVFEKFPVLGEMKSWLLEQPEVAAALLSGSGSTMLAVLNEHASADGLRSRALSRYGASCWTFVGETL